MHARHIGASCSLGWRLMVPSSRILQDCHRLIDITSHLDPSAYHLPSIANEHGTSCLALPEHPKCFPITQFDHGSTSADPDTPEVAPYKDKPIRQVIKQQPLVSGARSIMLRWPDGMQHAVFFTDQVCHDVQTGRPEFTWHVERLGVQPAQCENPPAGLFRSVEFMNLEKYNAFSRRMRGQEGGATKAWWRGML